MFIRTTSVKIEPSQIQAFRAESEAVRKKLKEVPGISHVFSAITDEGDVLAIGIWESEEAVKAANEKIQAIWGSLSSYLRTAPTATAYPHVEQLAGPAHEM